MSDAMPRFRGVIFDLDGTLGNTLPVCISAFREAIEPYAGRAISDAEIIATFGPTEEGTVRALAPDNFTECLEDYLRHYTAHHETCPAPFEGITELLLELQQVGVRLGLVTGKGHRSTEISLRRFSMDTLFEFIETGSPHGPRKAGGIRQIVAKWGMEPANVVYVGDAPSDIHAAHEAGTAVVAAAWAETADAEILASLHPDALLTSVAALREYLVLNFHIVGQS